MLNMSKPKSEATQEDVVAVVENAETKGLNNQVFEDETLQLIDGAVKLSSEAGMANNAVDYQVEQQAMNQGNSGNNAKAPNVIDYQTERLYPQEYFPTSDKANQQGSYSGSIVGNVPLFTAGNVRMPFSMIDRRRRNIAQAKEKEAARRKELFEISMVRGADQYNRQINELSFNYIENELKKNNYNVDDLMLYNTPESIGFWKGLADRKAFANETVRVNAMMQKIIDDSTDPTKYVTDKDKKAAMDWMAGTMDINDFYENNDKFASMKNRVASHSNLMNAVEKFNPVLDKMFISAAADGTLFKEGVTTEMIDEWTKKAQSGDQSLWTTEFLSNVSPERIEIAAKEVKRSGDFVQTEEEIAEYLVAMIGNGQVSLDKAILDGSKNRNVTKVNINMPGENDTKTPNPIVAMVSETMYDDDRQLRVGAVQMLDDMNNIDANDPDVDKKITTRFQQAFPDVKWKVNPNGEYYGEVNVPDFVYEKEVVSPLSSVSSKYRIQNTDGSWTTLNNTDNKKGGYFDASGELRPEVRLKVINVTMGLEADDPNDPTMRNRAVNRTDLTEGLVNNENMFFGTTVAYRPTKVVPMLDENGKQLLGTNGAPLEEEVLDDAAPLIYRTFDMRESFSKQAIEEMYQPLQDTEYKNQESSNQRVKSASTQGASVSSAKSDTGR